MSVSKVILVTGATGSIGREVSAQAAEAGMTVVVHGRTSQSAEKAVGELKARVPGGTFVPMPCDFIANGAIPPLIAAIGEKLGRLDGVVNCAVSAPKGISGAFLVTDSNVYGELCFHAIATLQILCREAFPLMSRNGGGSFVAYTSDAGVFAAPNQSMIGPTRAAIINFCRNVALEVSHSGIRVNAVSMSYVEDTAIFDMLMASGSHRPETARKRAGLGLPRPVDLAALTLFLLGPGSAKITGQCISVNGGLNA
jgi:3-oxoacyl-[acyl-carrier protein] reductase